jgi:hypothetical protein
MNKQTNKQTSQYGKNESSHAPIFATKKKTFLNKKNDQRKVLSTKGVDFVVSKVYFLYITVFCHFSYGTDIARYLRWV